MRRLISNAVPPNSLHERWMVLVSPSQLSEVLPTSHPHSSSSLYLFPAVSLLLPLPRWCQHLPFSSTPFFLLYWASNKTKLNAEKKKTWCKETVDRKIIFKKQCASGHNIGPSFKMLFCLLKYCGSLNLKKTIYDSLREQKSHWVKKFKSLRRK